MKKLFLSVIGMYIGILAAFSQNTIKTDSVYKPRKLSFEEANLVSSYYSQNGDNAAVTGGLGSEKLTDFSNSFDVKFSKYDHLDRKHTLTAEVGIDHYTSASSDKIDPSTISSASSADTRVYPSLAYTIENANKGTSIGAGLSYSNEFDYNSFGANVSFSKKTKDGNGELSTKLQAYFDQVTLIYPIELRSSPEKNYGSSPRKTYSGNLGWSQVVNQKLQLSLEGEIVYQQGYLGLPFHRVYFNDYTVHVENLPDSRLKIPIGLRANYFIGDKLIFRTWYRYYFDDWGINSNALQLETSYKVSPFFSITPFYRFYQQSAVDYFAPYSEHTGADEFYTSNYDLSKFNSSFFGAGLRLTPPQGVFNIQHLNMLELRYGHYNRTTGLNSNIISLNLKFK